MSAESEHLEQIAAVLTDVAAGRFESRVPRTRSGDVQDVLAFLVNSMAAEVGSLVASARRSEARWRAIFEQTPEGILVMDGEGCVLDANRAACDL
ncbi:MAG: PAS domain S-box protein, partial [Myxococcales bacterium]|nr:PAS domain S-box protein [Myxococcales bacterium]